MVDQVEQINPLDKSSNGIYIIHGLSLFSRDLIPATGCNLVYNFSVYPFHFGCSLFVSPAAVNHLSWGHPATGCTFMR